MPCLRSILLMVAGVVVVAIGAATAVFGVDGIDDDPLLWAAAAAVFVALVVVAVPVRSSRTTTDAGLAARSPRR